MTEKNNIINRIASEKLVERYIYNFHPDSEIRAELAQEVYLILLEYREGVIEEAEERGTLKFLVFRIAKNLIFSTTSSFYHKFMKYENNRRALQLCERKCSHD